MNKTGLYKNVRTWVLGLVILCVLLSSQAAIAQDSEAEVIYYDYVEDGVLKGGTIEVDPENPHHTAIEDPRALFLDTVWNVNTIINNGPTTNRIDLVFVGDGYTELELGDYATHVSNVVAGFFAESPLDEYASFFNVHRVDVISNESGVDHDPTYPIWRDTELDMGFWCGGTERLLCVNVSKALAAANQAPDRDQTLAVANSTKYGGAGYSGQNLGTLAGGNELALELALHEFGHSFADLGDEYWTEDRTYTGSEPSRANLSTYYADTMANLKAKWYLWLDEDNVWTFEGGNVYYAYGIYRPTDRSKMRVLNRPFEQVNVEQFVFKIYEIVSPIDDATPPGTYPVSTVFFVEPLQPATHDLGVQWYLDMDPIPGATGTTFDASTLGLSPGTYTLKAEVVDNTELVRDEDMRASWMSASEEWTLEFNDSSHLNDTSKFYVKNSSGENVAWFGSSGNLVLKGTLTENTTPTPTANDEFRVQDSAGNDVAIIDATNGNMYISGWLYEQQATLSPSPASDDFIIKDSSGNVVAYIDDLGDLYLKGRLYENSNP